MILSIIKLVGNEFCHLSRSFVEDFPRRIDGQKLTYFTCERVWVVFTNFLDFLAFLISRQISRQKRRKL